MKDKEKEEKVFLENNSLKNTKMDMNLSMSRYSLILDR
jgi:hypothetical protein